MLSSKERRALKRSTTVLEELYKEVSQSSGKAIIISDGTMVTVTEESIRITVPDGRIALYRREMPDGWRPESVLIPAGRRGQMGAYNPVEQPERAKEGMRIVFQARRSVNALNSTK